MSSRANGCMVVILPKDKVKDFEGYFDAQNDYAFINTEIELAESGDSDIAGCERRVYDISCCYSLESCLIEPRDNNIRDVCYNLGLRYLDTPFRPSDLEQREGRIIRQGNENKTVWVYTYVTLRTFDSYSYQILENKQKFIAQINHGDYSVREAEDIDDQTFNYAQVKAITSGNPKILRKLEIEQRLGQLSSLENDYRSSRYHYQEIIVNTPKLLERHIQRCEKIKQDIAVRDIHKNDLIQIGNQKFAERKDAGALLLRVLKSEQYIGKTVGMFRGFKIVPMEKGAYMLNVKLVGVSEYEVGIGDSDVGAITRLENETDSFEKKILSTEKERAEEAAKLAKAQIEVDKPFEYAAEVETLQTELSAIDAELDLNKQETPVVMDDEAEPDKVEIEVLDETEEEPEVA